MSGCDRYVVCSLNKCHLCRALLHSAKVETEPCFVHGGHWVHRQFDVSSVSGVPSSVYLYPAIGVEDIWEHPTIFKIHI